MRKSASSNNRKFRITRVIGLAAIVLVAAVFINALPNLRAQAESNSSFFGLASFFSWNSIGEQTVASQTTSLLAPGMCETAGPIEVESSGGTSAGTPTAYATLGAAFTAINAGVLHTGTITIDVCANSSDTAPAILNSTGTGANYDSITIRPTIDGATISATTATGRGVIELNGADNVTIDGDNPNSAGTNRNLTISNTAAATVTAASSVRISTGTGVGTYASADNNTIKNLNLLGNVTGGNASAITSATGSSNSSFGLIVGPNGGSTVTAITSVTGALAASTTVNNLIVDNNSVNQAARAIVFIGSSAASSTGVTISNNTVGASGATTPSAPPFTSPSTTVYTKGIYVQGTNAISITGNTLQNIMSYVGTLTAAVELNSSIGTGAINISNNTINTVQINATTNSSARGISVTSAGAPYTISGNTVSNIGNFAGSTTTQPVGIGVGTAATSGTIERNKISGVYNRNTGSFGAFGMQLGGGSNINVRNNFISDVNQSITGGATFLNCCGVYGMLVSSGTGHKVYNNSVNLFGALLGTSTSGNSTASLFIGSTTLTGIDVRNNILANTMTGGTTGIAHVSLALPTNAATPAMNLTINNNAYYSGTDAARQGIAQAGATSGTGFYLASNFNPATTTPATNLRALTTQLGNASNDNASFASTSAAPFVSNTDLHIPNGTATQLESGGANVGVTTDIDNEVRPGPAGSMNGGAVAPDIGADEFDGIIVDNNAPAISYTAFGNTTLTTSRTLTVTITDVIGVAQGALSPRIYFRKNGMGNYVSTQCMLASGNANSGTYNCVIDPSLIGGLMIGDVIDYFVIAQDANGNITSNPTGATATDVNTVTTPPAMTNSYTIVAPFASSVNVGTGEAIESLTNAGGLFAQLNAGILNGNVTVNITTDLTVETGAVSLNQLTEDGAGGYTVTFQASGGARVISGSNTTALINLNGADRITFSGLAFGGNSLLIRNTSATTGAVVRFINDASSNSIVSCTLEGGNTSTASGVVLFGTGATTGNDNNSISDSTIRDRTDVAGVPAVLIASAGTSATVSNSGNIINNNKLTNFTSGGFVSTINADNWTFTNNEIFQTAARTTALSGINFASTGTNMISGNSIHDLRTSVASGTGISTAGMFLGDARNTTVSRNRIYNFAAVAAGTGRIVGVEFGGSSGNPANVNLVNNMISVSTTVATAQSVFGIFDFAFGGNTFTADFNSIYIGGTASGAANSWALHRGSAAPTTYTARNNIAFNNRTGGTGNHFAAGDESVNTGTFVSNFNFFAGTGGVTPANFFLVGSTAADFATWQAGPPARDANSIAGLASSFTVSDIFVNADAGDLHLKLTAMQLINAGTPVMGITTDFDGQTRDATPDIGADEIVPGTLVLSAATYTVGEGDGTVTITVNRTGGTNGAVSVNYALGGGTATGGADCMTAGVDYINTGGTVMFADGDDSETFTVTICNDSVFEGNETFDVTLSGATGGATVGMQSTATVTITEDKTAQPGTFDFGAATYMVAENGGSISVPVNRTGGSNVGVTVSYSVGGTATGGTMCGAGVDYVTPSGSLTFNPGDTTQNISITICDDMVFDGDKTIILTLTGADNGGTIGMTNSSTTITITDNEMAQPGSFEFSSATYSGNEDAGAITVTVNRTGGSDGAATVNYATSSGSATGGGTCLPNVDYMNASGILMFANGETMKTFTVTPCVDTNVEPDETVNLTLSMPTGGASLGTQTTAVLTILNDDVAGPANVVVNPGNGSYATLKDAFDAINAGMHTGAVTVDIMADTTETASAALNASGTGSASYTSISITPTGARTISGNVAGEGMILLNGADNVTIDGLNTGGNSLTISNTAAVATSATSTIRFIGGASNNTVTNSTILGSFSGSLATNGGNIFFSTDANTPDGNDNNTISNNNIGPAGTNLPTKLIYGNGSTTTPAIRNSGIVINNNNLYDYFSATTSVSGMHILSGNDSWTISNNRIYQTAARTFTGTALRYAGITINSTTTGNQGAFTVTGNRIGFGAADGTGTTTISGSTNTFRGIDAPSVSTTTPTSIQGNTVSGINQTTSSTATGTTANFVAMMLGTTTGRFDVGNVTGNNIGSMDGSSTIVVNVNANSGNMVGIYDFSVSSNTISNNNIGAITIQGTGTTTGFRGILVNTGTANVITLTNNTIGGTNAAGSITNTQVGAYSMYGIQLSLPSTTATGNTIRNMNGNSTTANGIVLGGIITTGSTTGVSTITQNTVHSLTNNAGAASNSIYAIYCSLPGTANVISRNSVSRLSVVSTAITSQMVGILPVAGSGTYQNNMVSLGTDAAGNPITTGYVMYGMFEIAGTNNIYHNSVYLGGTGVTAPGSATFAFVSNVNTGTRNYLNNIFYNGRSNAVSGGAAHVALGLNTGLTGLTSNYNDLYAPGTDGFVGSFNATNYATLMAFQTATGTDANSKSVDPLFVSATNLHLQQMSPMVNMGTTTPVTDDFDGDTRDAMPDIGADEVQMVAMPGTFQFSAADYPVGENGTINITVTRTGGSSGAATVSYATVAGGTATGGADCMTDGVDYISTSGILMFADGETMMTFPVTICPDTTDEPDETINLQLSNATGGAMIGMQSTATITISDDDDAPTISINDVSMNEGDSGTTAFTFNVTLSAASGQTVTVQYATADNTATQPGDYTAEAGTLTFAPGETMKTVIVNVNGDTTVEPDETFFVNLSNESNATIADNQGQGTILNDDSFTPGTLSINDVRVLEGDSGTQDVMFTVTLTNPNPQIASVQYTVGGGTATAGVDYTVSPMTGTLFFGNLPTEKGAGGTDGVVTQTATVKVTINGDTMIEPNETFFVTLSSPMNATIGDDQGVGIIIDDDRAYSSDFDNDRKTDFTVFRPSTGFWYIHQSTNNVDNFVAFGASEDIPVPGDYDADGIIDVAVFRPSVGTWYIQQSSNFAFVQRQWGAGTDKTAQGDYDGDGKTDIAVFRPSNGTWYVVPSSDPNNPYGVAFGAMGDVPVQGDYDGDGKTDFAVYRAGTWYVLMSQTNQPFGIAFGAATDKPVVGDFDGDGKNDFVVYRSGTWFLFETLTNSSRAIAFGDVNDIPTPGDYDGDGTSDISVYRPGANSIFYYLNSSDNSFGAFAWGQTGDLPIPAYHQSQPAQP